MIYKVLVISLFSSNSVDSGQVLVGIIYIEFIQ